MRLRLGGGESEFCSAPYRVSPLRRNMILFMLLGGLRFGYPPSKIPVQWCLLLKVVYPPPYLTMFSLYSSFTIDPMKSLSS